MEEMLLTELDTIRLEQRGLQLFKENNYTEAAYWFGKAAAICETYGVLSNQGLSFFKAGNFAEAIDCFSRAVKLSPDAGTYFNMGVAAERIHLHAFAEEAFSDALKLDEWNYPAALGMCRSLRRREAYSEELSLLLKIRKKHPSANIDISVFNCLHRLGRPVESMVVFNIMHGLPDAIPKVDVTQKLRALHQDLWAVMADYNNDFGSGGFYQSFEELLIPGMRPSQARLTAYGLMPLLTPRMSVLDIGCNHGFLSLKMAPRVRRIVAIDNNCELIRTAKLVQRYLRNKNVKFVLGNAINDVSETFDIILSCAVHQWVGLPFAEYVAWIRSRLVVGGHVLFESNDLATYDADYMSKVEVLLSGGFSLIRDVQNYDDGVIPRRAVLVRRDS